MEKEKLAYSLDEACKATSLSRRSLSYAIEAGVLKAAKINRRIIISAESLHNLIETGASFKRGAE